MSEPSSRQPPQKPETAVADELACRALCTIAVEVLRRSRIRAQGDHPA